MSPKSIGITVTPITQGMGVSVASIKFLEVRLWVLGYEWCWKLHPHKSKVNEI